MLEPISKNSLTSISNRLRHWFGTPVRVMANGVDSMKMTALGAWAANELSQEGAETVEIIWFLGEPDIEILAKFPNDVIRGKSTGIPQRDKAVMTAVSQIIDGRSINLASDTPWWHVLDIPPTASSDEINLAYKTMAMNAHPDRGGSHEAMARLNKARDAALS